MVLEDVVEVGVLLYEYIYGFVANKLHLYVSLTLDLVLAHGQDLWALLFARAHAPVKVLTHRHALHLHVDFSQNVVSRHLLVDVINEPGLPQQFVGKVLGLGVATFDEKNPAH